MIFDDDGKVRLTDSEFNRLRAYAARNGIVIRSISDLDDLLCAIIDGLSDETAESLRAFLEANPDDSDGP